LHAAKILVVVFITILTTSLHAKEPFGFDSVADRAKKLAAEPFRAPPSIPEFLTRLSYDEYRDIRFDTKRSLWRERGNFQVQFVHPGLAALGVFEPRCNRPRDPVAGAFPDPGRKPVTAGRRKLTNLLK
jgi:glucan biosynthesis protein